MSSLSLSVMFRRLLEDRRTYCRVEAFVPGRAAPDWRGDDELALACGHAGLFEVGVVEFRDPEKQTVIRALQRCPASFWSRFLPLGQFDAASFRDGTGKPILHIVGDPGTLRVLIDFGLDVNRRSDDGWTPLQYGVARASLFLSCARERALVLLEAGAEITDEADVEAIELEQHLHDDPHLIDALKICVRDREAGIDRLRSLIKPEQLMAAAERGDLPRIQELIDEEGVDPNDERSPRGFGRVMFPLVCAAGARHDDCVEFLLSRGAHITERCFSAALSASDVRSLLLFLGRAPEVGRSTTRTFSWLREAWRRWQEDEKEGMKQLRSLLPLSDLVKAAKRGDVRAVRRVLSETTAMRESDLSDIWRTLLTEALDGAAGGGHWHVVRALLDGVQFDDKSLHRALAGAVASCDVRSALLLLERGGRVDNSTLRPIRRPSFHPRFQEAMRAARDDTEQAMRRLREIVGE